MARRRYKSILVSSRIVVFIVFDCQEKNRTNFIDEVKVDYDQCFYQLLHEKPIPRFGTLLRQVCDSVGIKQPLLEKYGQAEYKRMEEAGSFIAKDAPPSSMLQQVISLVILGKQHPSYLQTFIWIKVIKAHYNNAHVKEYFSKKGLEMPVFTPELEEALWVLSGHYRPDAVQRTIDAFAEFDYVPRRLPRAVISPQQTDHNIHVPHPQEERHTGPLEARRIREH
jgi:hypothetical protein